MTGRADRLDLGTWNVACSMCGRKRKANQMVKNWQGMWRCPEHNEPRQPQDFVRGVQDIQTPAFVQPQLDTYPLWINNAPFATLWSADTPKPQLGNGVLVATYSRTGSEVSVMINLTVGSTTVDTAGQQYFSLPPNNPVYVDQGGIWLITHGSSVYSCRAYIMPDKQRISAQYAGLPVTDSYPVALSAGDTLAISLMYDAA